MHLSRRALLGLLGLLAVPFGLFLAWTELDLRPRLERQVATALEREARLAATASAGEPFSDPLADRLGAVAGLRVTLIAPDGGVLGDSDVSARQLPRVENHAGRPEVRAALGGEVGSAVRASTTVARRLLYVAVPDARGVIRLAIPLDQVDSLVTRSRQWVLAGGFVALIVLLLLGRRIGVVRAGPLARIEAALGALGEADFPRAAAADEAGILAPLAEALHRAATRLRDTVEPLRETNRELELVFDELDDGVAVVDGEGVVRRANRAFERWLGRPGLRGERIGALFRDPENRQVIEAALAGREGSHESRIGEHVVLLAARPHADGALVMLRDLTHTRQLESVRRDFVANVSHELKTPLTNVRGFAEAIAGDTTVPEDARGFAERIVANSRRMEVLVDDLLDLSRIESGAWHPLSVEVDPGGVSREVWRSLEPGPAEKNVSLQVDIPDGVKVMADPDAVRQILTNLLDNALRYAPEGTAVRVAASPVPGPAQTERGFVRVEVRDEGPGIPAEHRERVWERFYRVDEARSREAGGTGLGLSIVKHLVGAHGGEAGLDSEVGRGTTVWFTLPAAP